MSGDSKRHMRGATFLGILTIVAILGFALYAGIRLVPLYMDYMSVVKAMNDTAKSFEGSEVTPSAVRDALAKRWQVDYINSLDFKDIEVSKVANGMEMRANYRAEAPFVANISLVVDFDKAVVISNRSGF